MCPLVLPWFVDEDLETINRQGPISTKTHYTPKQSIEPMASPVAISSVATKNRNDVTRLYKLQSKLISFVILLRQQRIINDLYFVWNVIMFCFLHVCVWPAPAYCSSESFCISSQWRHNGCDRVSNHQPHDCLLDRLFGGRSKKISKLRVTGLCVGNSPVIGEFPAQRASNAEDVSIWWRHHHECVHLFYRDLWTKIWRP